MVTETNGTAAVSRETGSALGGRRRAEALTPERRSEIARMGAVARWNKPIDDRCTSIYRLDPGTWVTTKRIAICDLQTGHNGRHEGRMIVVYGDRDARTIGVMRRC